MFLHLDLHFVLCSHDADVLHVQRNMGFCLHYQQMKNVRKLDCMVYNECIPFTWNFWVGFLGQMEQYISCSKNGSKYDAVPFV